MKEKIAVAFPGQGGQKPKMALSLRNTQSWRFFDQASEILGFDLGKLCLEGSQEDGLNDTTRAQPAIFVTSYALWDHWKEQYNAKVFLGHSLGEITALAAAGAFSFIEGVKLVAKRGECMAQGGISGGMAAVLGLDLPKVKKLCAEIAQVSFVQVANENSPQQIVVSGLREGLELFKSRALTEGAKRVVFLNVSGPFHSLLMEPAALEFAKTVRELSLKSCTIPVLSNDGKTLLSEPDQIRNSLVSQITNPVHFIASIEKLPKLGIDRFVEVGNEPLLTSFVRRINSDLQFALVSEGGM